MENWLSEDIPHFDYGGFVVGEKHSSAVILCKSKGIQNFNSLGFCFYFFRYSLFSSSFLLSLSQDNVRSKQTN